LIRFSFIYSTAVKSHQDIILSRISLSSITVEVNQQSYRDKAKVCTMMYALDNKVPASLKHINTTRFYHNSPCVRDPRKTVIDGSDTDDDYTDYTDDDDAGDASDASDAKYHK